MLQIPEGMQGHLPFSSYEGKGRGPNRPFAFVVCPFGFAIAIAIAFDHEQSKVKAKTLQHLESQLYCPAAGHSLFNGLYFSVIQTKKGPKLDLESRSGL